MDLRNFILFLLMAPFLTLAACNLDAPAQKTTTDSDQTTESDISTEASESMADSAGGALYVLEEELDALESAGTGASLVAASLAGSSRATVTIVPSWTSATRTYYDASGASIGSSYSSLASSVTTTRNGSYTVTTSKTSGTVAIESTFTVSKLNDASSATWNITGKVKVIRDKTTVSGGRSLESLIVHDLILSVDKASHRVTGGSASSTAELTINQRNFQRTWSWEFSGNGTAVLTLSRGSTVTITVQAI
mgnify:CR=1 FL=1